MKNNHKHFSLVIAAGIAGAAALSVANSEFVAQLPFEIIFAAATAAGIIQIAVSDYTRQAAPVTVPARVLRPAPAASRDCRRQASSPASLAA
jgi:hypothetical protein